MLPDPLGDYLDALAQAGFMTEDPGIEPDAEAAAPALDALLGSEISIPDELIGAVGVHVGMLDGKLEGSDTPEIERSIARLSKVCEYSAVRAELAASLLSSLSVKLGWVGRRGDALAPTEEAVDIYRRLAEADPAAHLFNLASSLNDLGIRLLGVGRPDDALAPTEEATGICRRLAEANSAAYLPHLASSLNNLGIRLSAVGRRDDALAPTEEAADIYRRLAEANPAVYLPDLAMSLNNLGAMLSGVGRRDDALAPAEEAADIYRRLAKADPAAHLSDLAGSLDNLGSMLSGMGRRDDALTSTREAASIRRRLAETSPAVYLPDLAMSLINLGAALSEVGRRDDALAPGQEAADIYRRLTETSPAVYRPNLAMSLNNLGNMLSGVGRRDDALAPGQEAADIYRQLAETSPAAYLPNLAGSLNNLGSPLSEVGRRDDALAVTQEAADIYRRLTETNPAAYRPNLAMSLNNLGNMLSVGGRRGDALAATQEAADIYRQLAETNPAAYLPDLASSLNNLGTMLSEVRRSADAIGCWVEVCGVGAPLGSTSTAVRNLLGEPPLSSVGSEGVVLGLRHVVSAGFAEVLALPGRADRARAAKSLGGMVGPAVVHLMSVPGGVGLGLELVDTMVAIEARLLGGRRSEEFGQLEALEPGLAAELREAWRLSTASAEDEQGGPVRVLRPPNQVLAEIRGSSHEVLTDFGRGRRVGDIIGEAQVDTLVLAADQTKGVGLLIRSGSVEPFKLDLLSLDRIDGAFNGDGEGSGDQASRLRRAARDVVGELLGKRSGLSTGLVVVPVGAVSLLPLQNCFAGQGVVARLEHALPGSEQASQEPAELAAPAAVGWFVGFSQGPRHLESDTGQPEDEPGGFKHPIPLVEHEAAVIAATVQTVPTEMTGRTTTSDGLSTARRAHLSCHAQAGATVNESALMVGEEELTLGELVASGERRVPEFVGLSACGSGRNTFDDLDQAVGFPSMLIALGARSVMATLWPVGDRDAATFTTMFYTRWAASGGTVGDAFTAHVTALQQQRPLNTTFAAYALFGDPQLRWDNPPNTINLTETPPVSDLEPDRLSPAPLDPTSLASYLIDLDYGALDGDALAHLLDLIDAWLEAQTKPDVDGGDHQSARTLAAELTRLGARSEVLGAQQARTMGDPTRRTEKARNEPTRIPDAILAKLEQATTTARADRKHNDPAPRESRPQ